MEKLHPLDSPGLRAKIIARLGVSGQVVTNWKLRNAVPIEHCAAVHLATDGEIARWHLRPHDWHLIWPELIGTVGAPAVPQAESTTTAAS